MAPDLNSLPPSSSSSSLSRVASSSMTEPTCPPPRGDSPGESPRTASTSLQAAATLNAGLQHEPTPSSSSSSLPRPRRQSTTSGRRRSVVLMNLQLNDPSLPPPGEMVTDSASQPVSNGYTTSSPQPMSGSPMLLPRDPHHNRTPSLGELHQELEAESEAQVNRLLLMIRQQQLQLQQLQASQGQNSAIAEDSAVSERSFTERPSQIGSAPQSAFPGNNNSFAHSPRHPHPRSSFDMARADLHRRSRTPSRGASPRLRSTSISGEVGDGPLLGGRDESAFYQAETQMLMRENQMLRHRIRDLEKQLSDASSTASTAHEPSHHSHLMQTTSATERGATPTPAASASK